MPELMDRLQTQSHRRFVKTHTPLDGIVLDPRATYVVVARHPLDAAVSLYHQGNNLDRLKMAELTGRPISTPTRRRSLAEWLAGWATQETTPRESMDSLVGHLHHASDAWARAHAAAEDPALPRVVLVHYADLLADLTGTVNRLAVAIGADVARVARTVDGARFEAMRTRATEFAPNAQGVLKDPARFFRSGTSGEGRAALGDAAYAAFETRCRGLAPLPVVDWLLR